MPRGTIGASVPRVPDHGLDEEKLAALLRWGTGLQADVREEVAAAGRAIVMLVEEVERLHVLVWSNRLFPRAATETDDEPASSEPASPPEVAEARVSLVESLRSRLRRGERAAAVFGDAADAGGAAETTPPSTFGE